MSNISIPKGTRDFSPAEMVKRNYIFDTIREVYRLFGYMPIETPAMESLETLTGKYGDEGDKLLFRVLNSGNFLQKAPAELLNPDEALALSNVICEKGLRYDLTVPFARYVVQHRNEIVFPFKRSQIQPVWRADRPQKGRYREFFQCDADVIGSDSLANEAELLQIIDMVFTRLQIGVCIKLNNRKILSGIAETMGQSDKLTAITVAIDKIEKAGIDLVRNELLDKGITKEQLQILEPILNLEGTNSEKLDKLEHLLQASETGMKGIAEMRTALDYAASLELTQEIELDLSLARGLDYYTGAIIEVKAKGVEIGSICGGGRYDNLTGIFGLRDVSGVGISFGADRIYDVLTMLNLFPESAAETTRILFANMGATEERYCMKIVKRLRESGVAAELYPEQAKLKKQLEYADKRSIPFVAVVGENEMTANVITLKNMHSREQHEISLPDGDASHLISAISTL
jgi:histidyl-tRNA synthetase